MRDTFGGFNPGEGCNGHTAGRKGRYRALSLGVLALLDSSSAEPGLHADTTTFGGDDHDDGSA